MPWNELAPKKKKNLDDLVMILDTLSDSQNYVFRGQSSRRYESLSPSIHRKLAKVQGLGNKVMLEAEAIAAFRRHARSLLHHSELVYLDLIRDGLTLMQHYGGPTRLLDWTMSPWVAAYFAAADKNGDDGLIWAFNRTKLLEEYWSRQATAARRPQLGEDEFLRYQQLTLATTIGEWTAAALEPSNIISVYRYQFANPQMSAQQSLFTISGTLEEDHDVTIARMLGQRNDTIKIVVPEHLKKMLQQRLFLMNVGALSLFPSIDGVGRHISEAIQCGFPLGDEALYWEVKNRFENLHKVSELEQVQDGTKHPDIVSL